MQVGDLYQSNYGRGPYFARIVAIDGWRVELEMMRLDGTAIVVSYSDVYLASPSCGWKLIVPQGSPS